MLSKNTNIIKNKLKSSIRKQSVKNQINNVEIEKPFRKELKSKFFYFY